MKMNVLEKGFERFLETRWKLTDTSAFSLVYIRLLLEFEAELSLDELAVLLERQKQLRGESYSDVGFKQFCVSSREEMDGRLLDGTSSSRRGMLNRLQYASMLDVAEEDFFYLTEPVFEFAREMSLSPRMLADALESEFEGYKADQWGDQ